MKEVKERLDLDIEEPSPPGNFKRELFELTLEEFLELAPGPP